MNKEETIKWLESLKAEIGKTEHRTLWHYAEAIDMAIEALTHTDGDLISREDAIKAMEYLSEHYTDKGREYHPHIDFVIDELKMFPSATVSGWISCRERLPEDGGLYLTTTAMYGRHVVIDEYIQGRWEHGRTSIVAWMPLPEPYRAEGE